LNNNREMQLAGMQSQIL